MLRFVTDDWKITQNLIRVQMLSKSLCGEKLARELISILSVTYSIPSNNMRDRASVNNVAMLTLKIVYPLLH